MVWGVSWWASVVLCGLEWSLLRFFGHFGGYKNHTQNVEMGCSRVKNQENPWDSIPSSVLKTSQLHSGAP